MKNIIFILAFMLTGSFAFANNTIENETCIEQISQYSTLELSSSEMDNVILSHDNSLDLDNADEDNVYYLGLCDVYVDGKYVGTYHVYIIVRD